MTEVHVADQVQAAMDRTGSIACVGLDPRPDLVPESLRRRMVRRHGNTERAVAGAFLAFNRRIIAAVAGHCAAVKPQAACYEAYGPAGWEALRSTVQSAHDAGLTVVVDAKRGDIGSTATHYRQAFFGGAPGLRGTPLPSTACQWLTVNGYLGSDGVLPMLGPPGTNGVFVLVRTSNPSSTEVQSSVDIGGDSRSGGADTVARLVNEWGQGRQGHSGLSDVGAVVGARFPEEARRLRQLMPDTLFLVPGYGEQGGAASDAVTGVRTDGRGLLVSSSRRIAGAWKERDAADWGEAARAELDAMNLALAGALR